MLVTKGCLAPLFCGIFVEYCSSLTVFYALSVTACTHHSPEFNVDLVPKVMLLKRKSDYINPLQWFPISPRVKTNFLRIACKALHRLVSLAYLFSFCSAFQTWYTVSQTHQACFHLRALAFLFSLFLFVCLFIFVFFASTIYIAFLPTSTPSC